MYSVTQGANIAQLLGLLLSIFGTPVDSQAIDGFLQVLGALIAIVGFIVSWVNRYSKGDITFGGARK